MSHRTCHNNSFSIPVDFVIRDPKIIQLSVLSQRRRNFCRCLWFFSYYQFITFFFQIYFWDRKIFFTCWIYFFVLSDIFCFSSFFTYFLSCFFIRFLCFFLNCMDNISFIDREKILGEFFFFTLFWFAWHFSIPRTRFLSF